MVRSVRSPLDIIATDRNRVFSVAELRSLLSRITHDLNDDLIIGVIQVESSMRAFAVSKKGARGLMQLMPSVYDDYAKRGIIRPALRDIDEPLSNVICGIEHLESYVATFGLTKGIMAYNMGGGNIRKGVLNYSYLNKVRAACKGLGYYFK
jgi:soluble lytic murein transglycosylase-like protein